MRRLTPRVPDAMKRALTIVAAVAAYSLLEAALLLSPIVAHPWYPGRYQQTVLAGQFLLIPGLAVFLSRIVHGPYRWGRRALVIFVAGSVGVPVVITLIFIPVAFLAWTFDVSRLLFAVLAPVVLGGMVVALFVLVRNSGTWTVQADATRWLTERQSATDPREDKWRKRGIRFVLWIPVLTVLPVFLFLPEIWGIYSHLSQPRSGNLAGYRVPIPSSWIVLDRDHQKANGKSWVTGMTGRGIGFGPKPYLQEDWLSSWEIRTEALDQRENSRPDDWMPKDDHVVARRYVTTGAEKVTCLQYWPYYPPRPDLGEDSTIVYLKCSGSGRFHASFAGPQNQLAKFYRVLGEITGTR